MGKTGPEIIDDIAEHPTLDRFLDRDPHAIPLTDQELDDLIEQERKERVFWNVKQDKAKAKKEGIEDGSEEDTGNS